MEDTMDDFRRLTVGELRDALKDLDAAIEIDFGSTVAAVRLEFYRFKMRGDDLLQIELSERFPEPGKYVVDVDEGMGSFTVNAPHLR
jgi:hypothetical protein